MVPGWPLDWFKQEYPNVQAKLDILDKAGVLYNPERDDLFRALSLVSLRSCRVAIFAQDPYSNPIYAHGVALSAAKRVSNQISTGHDVGEGKLKVPASLKTIFREYVRDLHPIAEPTTKSLEYWCDQGVLLWNVTPTIEIEWNEFDNKWDTFTHKYWVEWTSLTREIVERLSAKGQMVFVFLGCRAHEYAKYVDTSFNSVMSLSHPSPRGQSSARNKFIGSRLFSSVNSHLSDYLKEPIDWRLP